MEHKTLIVLGCCSLLLVYALMADPAPDFYTQQHQDMLEKIQQDAFRTGDYTGIAKISNNVLNAMASVKRHEFVPDLLDYLAYLNRPLPIGENQTISQPFIVALMTDVISPQPSDKVLEIGTGSGYQAAVLAKLVDEVYTVEIIENLALEASSRLASLGYENVRVFHSDGTFGWQEGAPYDKIIVTAASELIPEALLEQLKPSGKMIIPLGPHDGGQELVLINKSAQGKIEQTSILPVRFVPFTGEAGKQNP